MYFRLISPFVVLWGMLHQVVLTLSPGILEVVGILLDDPGFIYELFMGRQKIMFYLSLNFFILLRTT